VISLALAFLPLPLKTRVAGLLERSVFLPFRLAVGWGPRSLLSEQRASRLAREAMEKRLGEDERLEVEGENERLRGLVGFGRRAGFQLEAATVVARGRERFGDLLVLRLSAPRMVSAGMPVLCPEGLLGRVSRVEGRMARVECLTHQNVAVSVRNVRSREGGIVKWRPDSGRLVIEGVPRQADWQAGDRLVTSGLGAAFPRGLLVGWVEGQAEEEGSPLKTVHLRPAASSQRVDEVFLLGVGAEGRWSETGVDLGALYPPDPIGRGRVPFRVAVGVDPGPVPVP